MKGKVEQLKLARQHFSKELTTIVPEARERNARRFKVAGILLFIAMVWCATDMAPFATPLINELNNSIHLTLSVATQDHVPDENRMIAGTATSLSVRAKVEATATALASNSLTP